MESDSTLTRLLLDHRLLFISADNLLSAGLLESCCSLDTRFRLELVGRPAGIEAVLVLLLRANDTLFRLLEGWRLSFLDQGLATRRDLSLLLHEIVLFHHGGAPSGRAHVARTHRLGGERVLFDRDLLAVTLDDGDGRGHRLRHVRLRASGVSLKRLRIFEFLCSFDGADEALGLAVYLHGACSADATFVAFNLRGHVDISRWGHHRGLVNLLRCVD